MTDNVHSLLGPYVVNAVTPAERADFEAHLAACEDCRDEVASLRDVTATLADAEAVAPPASLRSRVLAEATRTPQLPPFGPSDDAKLAAATNQATASADAGVEHPAPSPSDASSVANIAGPRRPRPARRRNALIGIAAASVLILGAAGIGVAANSAHQEQVSADKELMMVTTAPDAHSMDLDLGTSHLVMSDKMDGVVAMGQGAPMPQKGMEYQLWLMMDDGQSMPGPTFTPEGDGEFVTMMHTSFDDVAGFMVTQEPMGGSDAPTSAPLTEVHL